MIHGFSHVCPYWGQGYCLFEGSSPCFFLQKERKPDPAHFRLWFRWREKLLRFLDALSVPLGVMGKKPVGNPVPLPTFEKVKGGRYACPFLVLSDPKRTVMGVLPAVREGYRDGYLLNRWEREEGKASSPMERQQLVASLISRVEGEEAILNGTVGGSFPTSPGS